MLIVKIAEWAIAQAPWVSDASRRLLQNCQIDDKDIPEILVLLKSHVGLAEPQGRKPLTLTLDMIPAAAAPENSVALLSLRNLKGVNAFAPDQKVDFAVNGSTVIYGDNGAGKFGYSRVLQKACRARATGGPILGNVFGGSPKSAPSAEIEFRRVGVDQGEVVLWRQNEPAPPELAVVAVFESQCAKAFTDTESEVAYIPRSLDLRSGIASLKSVSGDFL